MRYTDRVDRPHRPLISLTDPHVIATEVKWLRSEGYSELAVWRHFLQHFVVDLDALSLIIAKLFAGPESRGITPNAVTPSSPEHRRAA
jgi:hypothetical protein